jgi:hypothetical protein
MKEILNYIFSKNTLLALISFIVGTYIILFKYNNKNYIYLFLGMLVFFMIYWDDPDKYIWLWIFINLTITMIVMENVVVYVTNGKAISYNSYNLFNRIPYWLPIAYWNSIIFIVYHYRLYSIIMKKNF